MDMPNWMKSGARKAREAAEAERARQEAQAKQEEQQRKYEAEYAAANTPEKLRETGTAMLIELIQTYPYVQVVDNLYWGKKWRFGNIELNSFYYIVQYCEGLKKTDLLVVPSLQRDAVKKALDARYQQLGGKNYVPVGANTPVAADVARFEQRMSGMKKEIGKQEEGKIRSYCRDVFMRLAQETLEKSK